MSKVSKMTVKNLSKKQERECRNAFEEWNNDTLRIQQWELFKGWKACYTWFIAGKDKEFEENINEMYNSYKQDNPEEDL